MTRKMTPEDYEQHVRFYHAHYLDLKRTDPEAAKRFIEQVRFETPEQIVETNELIFTGDNGGYNAEIAADFAEFRKFYGPNATIADLAEWVAMKENSTKGENEK